MRTATQGSPYGQTIPPSGGVAPYTYAIIAGALPSGLTLNSSSGVLSCSGVPTTSGASTIMQTIRAAFRFAF